MTAHSAPVYSRLTAPRFWLMTKLVAPSIVPLAAVTVIGFVAASPLPSLIRCAAPAAGLASKVTAVADPVALLMTIRPSAAWTVTELTLEVMIRGSGLPVPAGPCGPVAPSAPFAAHRFQFAALNVAPETSDVLAS